MDQPLKFYEVAKYYYFPGWHQQATLFDLYVNQKLWDGLAEQHKAIIELACGEVLLEMMAEGEAAQGQAIKEMQEEGVEVRRWPPTILVALDDAWNEVIAEESANNPDFKRVYESYKQFREEYQTWSYLSYLGP
jgi:TRAP-type mannitol/chloroaromatic compound transport system substrate-binding protein